MSDCADMSSFLSRCHSCRVESGCFIGYDRPNYMGNQYIFRRGEYAAYMNMMDMRDCIRSCHMIPMVSGQRHELMEDCDNIIDRHHMSDCMSCHMMDGHWLMYEQPHYRGKMMYLIPGEYRNFREMGYGGTRFTSMRRMADM
ncbi:hypothetical protein XENOCAPTIV_017428 [Xenoophorus captivus]|uniref:Beta/gamma crystallin 'Greek key' domain-containing protein n=1 Tax=Xenoophorus captivus TaxID=1517983 RepID=A0ABV0QAD7_9TELE